MCAHATGDNNIKNGMEIGCLRASFLLIGMLNYGIAAGSEEKDNDAIDTVTATATRLPAEQQSTSSTVLDAADIEARNPGSITELLRQVPGVNVSQQGGRGGTTDVLIRGGESNFTAVVVDGVRVNDPLNTSGGSYGFSGLDLIGVSRVELVRGPMSSLYGSDALAGVIAVTSGRSEPGGSVEVHGGTEEFTYAGLQFAAQPGSTTISASAHAQADSGGHTDYEDHGLNAALHGNVGNTSSYSIGLRHQVSDIRRFPQESGGPLLAVLREFETVQSDETHLRGAWSSSFADSLSWHVSASRYERDEQVTSPGIAPGALPGVPPTTTDNRFDRDQLLFTLSRSPGENVSFLLGAEWQSEQGDSAGTLDIGFPLPTDFQFDRDSHGLFAEVHAGFGALSVQASVRYDDIDAVGNSTSSRLGVILDLSEQWSLRINAGDGFKAPSFFALAHPLIGNATLRPEQADAVDARLVFDSGDGTYEVGVFRNDFTDLVDFDPVSFQLVNRSRVVTDGFEASASKPVNESVRMRAHVTYLRTDVRDSNVELRHRPRWRGGATIEWSPHPDWRLATNLLHVDAFYDSSIATGMLALDAYTRVDAALSWQANSRLMWRIAVDNLLDANYEEAVGFPANGVRVRVGLRYDF